MITGKSGEYYCDDHLAGYFDDNGKLIVTDELNLTDADTDRYFVQVQNVEGYYDSNGRYRSYGGND